MDPVLASPFLTSAVYLFPETTGVEEGNPSYRGVAPVVLERSQRHAKGSRINPRSRSNHMHIIKT
jgi:hypothetical protein